jgi:hypothetical protein
MPGVRGKCGSLAEQHPEARALIVLDYGLDYRIEDLG